MSVFHACFWCAFAAQQSGKSAFRRPGGGGELQWIFLELTEIDLKISSLALQVDTESESESASDGKQIQKFSTCMYPEPPKPPDLCLVEEVIEVISFLITSLVMSAIFYIYIYCRCCFEARGRGSAMRSTKKNSRRLDKMGDEKKGRMDGGMDDGGMGVLLSCFPLVDT